MAVITSTTTGNFSAGATWVGGVVPGAGDDAVAATGTVVTIDTNVTVLSFQQAGTGKFVLGGGRTVTGNVIANAGTFTSGGTVEVTAGVGTTATINGNVTGVSTTTSNTAGIVVTGVGTLVLNGSVTGSAGNNSSEALGSAGVYTNVACTLNVNGAVNGNGTYKSGIRGGASANPVITVIGNVSSGTNTFSHGVNVAGASTTVNVTGNVKSNAQAAHGISPTGVSQTLNITGNVDGGGGTGGFGINAPSSITINVVGNVSGSNGTNSTGMNLNGAATVANVTGSCNGGTQGSAYGIESTGASSVITVVGSAVGGLSTASGIVSAATTTNTGVIFQGNMIDGSQGASAVYTRLFRITGTQSGYNQHQNTVGFPNGTPVFRVSPDQVTGMPATSNVRFGTAYGYNSELTGQAKIPPASSVAAGAEVDNTVGSAALDVGSVIAVVGAQVAASASTP